MGFLEKFFGLVKASSTPRKSSQTPSSYKALAQSDVCDGMVFHPTHKLSTPLWILKKSGEVYQGKAAPPDYGEAQHGIWVPKLDSSFDIFDQGMTVASDAGSIEPDKYLQYAIGLLEIFESDASIHEKMTQASRYAKNNKDHLSIEQKVCSFYGQSSICEVMSRFISFEDRITYYRNKTGSLILIDGVSKKIATAMEAKEIRTIDQLMKLSEDELLGIEGIGKKTAAKISLSLQKIRLI